RPAPSPPHPPPRFFRLSLVTGLPLYFKGYLSVRRSRCQEFKVYWAELRGIMLYFYNDKKAPTYSQKLDISALISVTNIYLDENGFVQFILMLSNEELELKVKKGKLRFVNHPMSVPLDDSLSPGQVMKKHEVLEKDKKRRMALNDCPSAPLNEESPPSRGYSSTLTAMPNSSCGNLILKFLKMYSHHNPHSMFCLECGVGVFFMKQVTLPSLPDVINYFVTETQGNLKLFVMPTYGNMLQRAQHFQGEPAAGGTHGNHLTATQREKQHAGTLH
uniref:Signal transducing adaptor family member 1 n=1 Tax=Dromaius novaehollandiae TaxID=8790 RepID=A0A8C4KFK5_DRONO